MDDYIYIYITKLDISWNGVWLEAIEQRVGTISDFVKMGTSEFSSSILFQFEKSLFLIFSISFSFTLSFVF